MKGETTLSELYEFISQEEERLRNAGFDAEDIWDSAVTVGAHPDKASLALIEFILANPQVDFSLRQGQCINRFRLHPPGPKVEDLGVNKFRKFMFTLGITIE